jgi:hypothetical protein
MDAGECHEETHGSRGVGGASALPIKTVAMIGLLLTIYAVVKLKSQRHDGNDERSEREQVHNCPPTLVSKRQPLN